MTHYNTSTCCDYLKLLPIAPVPVCSSVSSQRLTIITVQLTTVYLVKDRILYSACLCENQHSKWSGLNYKHLTDQVKLARASLAAFHHIRYARQGRWGSASTLDGLPTASLQNPPAAPEEPSILLCLLFFLFTHIHPACLVCQSLSPSLSLTSTLIPPSCFPPLFLCSTGLVKVSQSPVTLQYRLQRFLFKWRLFSSVWWRKEWEGRYLSGLTFCVVILVFKRTPGRC